MLQDVLSKKALKPSRKRDLATDLMERFGASLRKSFAVIKLSRVVYLYQSHARDNSALVKLMKEFTQTRVHYGYRRVHVMLRREVFRDNHKRVYRLYQEQAGHCGKSVLSATMQVSLDNLRSWRFISTRFGAWTMLRMICYEDAIRMIKVVDCYTRERLDIHVD